MVGVDGTEAGIQIGTKQDNITDATDGESIFILLIFFMATVSLISQSLLLCHTLSNFHDMQK